LSKEENSDVIQGIVLSIVEYIALNFDDDKQINKSEKESQTNEGKKEIQTNENKKEIQTNENKKEVIFSTFSKQAPSPSPLIPQQSIEKKEEAFVEEVDLKIKTWDEEIEEL
jgi:hypothetical protein